MNKNEEQAIEKLKKLDPKDFPSYDEIVNKQGIADETIAAAEQVRKDSKNQS